MHLESRVALLLLSSLGLFACTSSTSSGSGAGGGGGGASSRYLPCDVEAVLVSACQSCHASTPQYGAVMPLVTYADLLAPAHSDPSRKVYDLVAARTHDDTRPMPQAPNPRLDAADQKVLDDWIAAGAPGSSASCGGPSSSATTGSGSNPLSCTPDLSLIPATSYTVPKDTTDIYICYGIDVTEAQKRHITAFAPRIDNSTVVHHVVLFQRPEADDPAPHECGIGGPPDSRMVTAWAPGGEGFELPEVAGVPLEGTTHYSVQVHYSNLKHLEGQSDHSGFALCTTDKLRPNDADLLAFGTMAITVPSHGKLDVTCDYTVPASLPPLHILGAMPHMHKIGTAIATTSRAGGKGAPIDLGHQDPWDFNTQSWTALDQLVSPGDVVSTRCAWNNPGATPVTFGEKTLDEMCWSFTMYYPKIEVPQWKWLAPSALSTCSPTP